MRSEKARHHGERLSLPCFPSDPTVSPPAATAQKRCPNLCESGFLRLFMGPQCSTGKGGGRVPSSLASGTRMQPASPIHTYTCSLTLRLTHTETLPHSHTLPHSYTDSQAQTDTCTLSHTHTIPVTPPWRMASRLGQTERRTQTWLWGRLEESQESRTMLGRPKPRGLKNQPGIDLH